MPHAVACPHGLRPAGTRCRYCDRTKDKARPRDGSTRRWRKLRRQILDRDNHQCYTCGSTDRLEVHHLNGNPNDHRPENLETRCFNHNPRGRVRA